MLQLFARIRPVEIDGCRPAHAGYPRSQRVLWTFVLLGSTALVAFVLFRYPPTEYGFYPRCPVATLLHFKCPGCGSTRALAALIRGRVFEALQFNALAVCALPIAMGYGLYRSLLSLGGRHFPALILSPATLCAGFGLVLLYTLARNL